MKKHNQRWASSEVAILRRYAKTHSAEQIAVMLGRRVGSVCYKAYRLGVSLKKYGDNNKNCRYPDKLVRQAKELAERGVSNQMIAEQLGLPTQAVRRWTVGETRWVVQP